MKQRCSTGLSVSIGTSLQTCESMNYTSQGVACLEPELSWYQVRLVHPLKELQPELLMLPWASSGLGGMGRSVLKV